MRGLHRTFIGRDVFVAVACVFALISSACAEGQAPGSNFSDVGPDAAAGAALATASLGAAEECANVSLAITSPSNNKTFTYTQGGSAITMQIDVSGVDIGTGPTQFQVQYRMDGVVEAANVPSTGSFTFNGVEYGRHLLTAHLMYNATGAPLFCEEGRAAVYVRVIKPCVFSQGNAQCSDGLTCSSDSCKSAGGGDNGECAYGPTGGPDCCDSVDECDLGWHCQNNSCVECLSDVDCLADSNLCTNSYCGVDGSCVHEPIDGCCVQDSDCVDSGSPDYCTSWTCNTLTNSCESQPKGGDLCCNVNADCKPSDPCLAYLCYHNTSQNEHVCRYGPQKLNCCTEDTQCNDGNECTQDICDFSSGSDAGTCIFESDPGLVGCCIIDSDCDDGDKSTADFCEPPNPTISYNHCANPVDPNYCALPNPGYQDHPDAIVINEMMIAPGNTPDTQGEWLEFFNASDHGINMTGWSLETSNGESYTFKQADKVGGGPVNLLPGQYLVWARSADNTSNGGFNPDGAYGAAISLPDLFETGQHQIVTLTLRDGSGAIVDSLTYDTFAWGLRIQDGRTTELVHAYADNAEMTVWEASGLNFDPSKNLKYGPVGAKTPGSPKVANKSSLRAIPHGSCTAGLDAGNPCVYGACSINSQCEYPTTHGCCVADGDCNDYDACTETTCDVPNNICNQPVVDPDCCDSNDDCIDGNPCNLDRCIGGVCRYSENVDQNCCLNDGDCTDGNECTINTCNVPTKECFPAVDVVLDGGAQCCQGPADCDDSNPATNDFCNFNTSPPQCTFVPNPNYCTDAADPCDDGILCTLDQCDVNSNQCGHELVPGCCTVNSDCPGDGNACTNEICDAETGNCLNSVVANCCLSDQDCDDGNLCTTDKCGSGNVCHNQPLPGCCNVQEDCDDGVPCTIDECVNFQCEQQQEEQCCTPGDTPANLLDSCGPDPDGTATCFVWTCSQSGQCVPQENPTCCNEHVDCDDGDPCTTDVCTTDHKCKNLASGNNNCCVSNSDCPNDDSVCTSAVCDAGSCGQLAIAGCSEPVTDCGVSHGPAVNAKTEGWDYGATGSCWHNDTAGNLGPDAHVECTDNFGAYGDGYIAATPGFNPSGLDYASVQFKAAWTNGAGSHQLVVLATKFQGNFANPYILGTIDTPGTNTGSAHDFLLPNALLVESQVWIGFKVVSDSPTSDIKVSIDDVVVAAGHPPFFVKSLNAAKQYDKVDDHLTDGGSAHADLDTQVTKVFWVHDAEIKAQDLQAELVGAPDFVQLGATGDLNLYDVFQIKLEINPTDPADIGSYDIILRVTDCGFTDEIPVTVEVGLGSGFVLYTPVGLADEASNALAALLDANNITYQRVVSTTEVADFSQIQAVFVTLGGGGSKAVLTNTEAAPLIAYLDGGGSIYMEGSSTFAEDPQTLLHPRFKVSVVQTDGGLPGNMVGRGNFFGQSVSYSILPTIYNDVDWLIPTAGFAARTAFQTELSAKTVMTTYVDDTNGSRLVASSVLLGHTSAVGATPKDVTSKVIDFLLNGYGACTSHAQCATGDPCEIAQCVGGQCDIQPDLTCEFCQDDGDCDNPGDICLPDGTCVPPEGDEVGDDVTPVQHNCDTTDERIEVVKNVAEFGTITNVHTKLKLVLDNSQKLGTYSIELKHGGVSVDLVKPDPTNTSTVLDIDFPLGKQPVGGSMNDFNGLNVNGDWILTLTDTTGGAKCATLTVFDLFVEHDPITCVTDAECSNGGFCDGDEICNGGTCQAGTPPTCNDDDPCTQNLCTPGDNQGAGACNNSIKSKSCAGAPCSGLHGLDGGDRECGVEDYCSGGLAGGSGTCTEVCATCEKVTMGPVFTPIPPGTCITETVEISNPKGQFAASMMLQLDVTHPDNGDLTVRLFSPSNAQAQILNGDGDDTANFSTTFPLGYDVDLCAMTGVLVEGIWKVQVCNLGPHAGVLNTGSLWVNPTNVDPTQGNSCANAIPFSGTDGSTLLGGDTTCFANETVGNCTGAAGHDIVYTFNLSSTKRITASVDASNHDAGLYITNSCAAGSTFCKDVAAQGETETIDTHLGAGIWYLVVDSFSSTQKGAFALTVDLATPLANGQACDEALDCASGHCANGYCCGSGDCCNVASSCPDIYSTDPSCDAASTCQGHRVDATCINSQCGSLAVDDDTACAVDLESDACALFVSVYCNGQQNQADPLCLSFCSSDANCDGGAHCFEGNNQCRVDLTNGINCGRDGHCASGECVDGVCCDSACDGLCEQCNKPGQLGQCELRNNGTDPENECQGDASLCDGKCDGNGQCTYTSDATVCSECTRCSGDGFCNNFVATNTDPDDTCATCTSCDGAGSCAFVPEGSDHVDDCADTGAGACGTNGACDGAGVCQLYAAGTVCTNQTCTDGYVDPNHTCDGAGSCQDPDDVFCTGLKCDDDGTPPGSFAGLVCLDNCASSDANCIAGYFCDDVLGQACLPKLSNGDDCDTDHQCSSNFCTDGVCCEAACAGACRICNAPGAEGSCLDHLGYTDPEGGAPGTGCFPYWCNGGGNCNVQCTTDLDCQDGFWCNGSQCEAKKDNGDPCSAGNQCTSDVCNLADGVCCDQSCTSTCSSCKLAGSEGTCTLIPSGADPDEECTGTDAVCGGVCNGAGSCGFPAASTDCGNCEICNGAGACVPSTANTDPANDCGVCQTCNGSGGCVVQPAGVDFHDDCAESSPATCGFNGLCNGSGACGFYGTNTTVAGAACPTDETFHPGTVCNGSGGSIDPGPASCGQYICDSSGGGPGCRTTCTEHAHCATGNVCDFNDSDSDGATNDCVAAKPDGSQCTDDFECGAGHCQNGFCCSGGNCCNKNSDCSFLGSAATCDSAAAGGCDGHRTDAFCDGNKQCQVVEVDDDSACAAQQCNAGGCNGLAFTADRFCNATGQCSVGGQLFSCDDGNPCTADSCDPVAGCQNPDDNGVAVPCYGGPAGTKDVGICKGGQRVCQGGATGECVGQVLPGTEVCAGNLDEDCDSQTNEEGAQGCSVWYRDNDNDGYGSTDAKCLCAATDPYDAALPTDCNDGNGNMAPNKPELCSTPYDDNCNSVINEDNASGCTNFYLDGDSDGYGVGSAHCQCGAKDPFDATNNNDCNDSNGDVSPGKAEKCNGFDDNCNGLVDGAEVAPHLLCGSVANVTNANIGCSVGQCHIKSCNLFTYNVDGLYSNGCERVEDQWDQADQGDFCGTSSTEAINIDTDMYEGEDHPLTANILPAGDVDWWRVKPRDNGTPGAGFEFDIRFTSNPGHHVNGGEHRFDVYRDSCSNKVCTGKKFYKLRSDINYTSSCYDHRIDGGGGGFGGNCGNQNCTGTAGNNDCGTGSQKCCHTNGDGNNRWFFIRVYHSTGQAILGDYTLRVSNDKNL